MNTRGLIASLAALAAAVVLPIAAATPAHAGADPTVVSWEKVVGSSTTCTVSTSTVRANPGDRFTLHNDCAPTIFYIKQGNVILQNLGNIPDGGQATITAPAGIGTYQIGAIASRITPVSLFVTDVLIPAAKAHDEFQQVGVPASGDCADVDPATGHYPGYPIGGWSQSWAQWINDGTGGPICTREVEQRPDGEIVLIG